jgi:hypothetical protein
VTFWIKAITSLSLCVFLSIGSKAYAEEEARAVFAPEIHGRIQTRVEYQTPEWGSDQWTGAFLVRRARLMLRGKALSPRVHYMLQTEFGQGSVEVKVLSIDYAITQDSLHIKVGHMRRPYGRHRMTPTSAMEFVERSGIHNIFGGGRDLGVIFHNGWSVRGKEGFEWNFGIMNGTPANVNPSAPYLSLPDHSLLQFGEVSGHNVPSQFNPVFVGRVGHNDGGMQAFREADLEGGPMRLSYGLNVMVDYGEQGTLRDGALSRFGLDLAFKSHGTSFTGVFYSQHQMGSNSAFDGTGYLAQLGHVFKGWVQPVVRYASINLRNEPVRTEIRGALNFYFKGHDLKWQTDVALLGVEADESEPNQDTWEVRSQLQLNF